MTTITKTTTLLKGEAAFTGTNPSGTIALSPTGTFEIVGKNLPTFDASSLETSGLSFQADTVECAGELYCRLLNNAESVDLAASTDKKIVVKMEGLDNDIRNGGFVAHGTPVTGALNALIDSKMLSIPCTLIVEA